MSINQDNMTINQVFDEIFSFPENIKPEQKKEIKNLFITFLVKSGKDISTLEKLKYELKKSELNELVRKKIIYSEQTSGITKQMSFEEFRNKLNELLINNDFSGLDEDFVPIQNIFDKQVDLNEAFSAFNKQRPQNYVDSIKTSKTSKFKLYASKKVEKLKSLPPKNFKKYLIDAFVGVAVFSVFVSSVAGFKFGIAYEKINQQNNVCVEYKVRNGDTNTSLDEMFYEYGYSHLAVSGADRNSSPNNGNPFEGDKVVGRTTREESEKLVSEGKARIISIEEAVELLEANHTLSGEFKRASQQNSNIVFEVPANEKAMG